MASATPFSFYSFKVLMKVADMDEVTYGLILRSIFLTLNSDYDIDIDTLLDVPFDLQLAVFTHARYIFERKESNADIIDSVTDAQGGRTSYKAKLPIEVSRTYRRYSPIPPASL